MQTRECVRVDVRPAGNSTVVFPTDGRNCNTKRVEKEGEGGEEEREEEERGEERGKERVLLMIGAITTASDCKEPTSPSPLPLFTLSAVSQSLWIPFRSTHRIFVRLIHFPAPNEARPITLAIAKREIKSRQNISKKDVKERL